MAFGSEYIITSAEAKRLSFPPFFGIHFGIHFRCFVGQPLGIITSEPIPVFGTKKKGVTG